MSEYWGFHLCVDAGDCNLDLIRDGENIKAFARELVKRIDMVAYGEPVTEHFAKHDPTKAGYTLCQMIETSLISGHFVDADGSAYIDVFSCKPFDIGDVVDTIDEYFEPGRQPRLTYLTRQA